MKNSPTNRGVRHYFEMIQDIQSRVMSSQQQVFDQVADKMVETIRNEKRIFVFGTGHSHMMAEEGFFRAGGLAPVVPIFLSGLMLHENALLSSRLERLPGAAEVLLDQFNPQRGEMLFVYSNSGVNHMPVEMALLGKARGMAVVGVLSRNYAQVAPLSKLGKRLDEVVDYVLDNMGEPGDALVPLQNSSWRVAASSTVISALIWNSLVTETVYRLEELGEELPVFISFNMPGAADHNQAVLEKWGPRNPYLKGWLQNG